MCTQPPTCYLAHVRTEGWQPDRFRETLKQISDRTGLGDKDLATLTGRSRSQVNRWRRAEHQPDFPSLQRLADGLRQYGPEIQQLGADLLDAAGYEPVIQVTAPEPGTTEARPTSFVAAIERADKLFKEALSLEGVPKDQLREAWDRLKAAEELILKRLLDRDEARAQQAALEQQDVRKTGT